MIAHINVYYSAKDKKWAVELLDKDHARIGEVQVKQWSNDDAIVFASQTARKLADQQGETVHVEVYSKNDVLRFGDMFRPDENYCISTSYAGANIRRNV